MIVFIRNLLFLFFFLKSASAFPQVVALVGDFENTPVNVDSVSMLVKSWAPDIIVTSGDNFDPLTGTIDDAVGPYYSDYIYPYTGVYGAGAVSNRFFPALGNHELYTTGPTQYLNYYTLPGNERYYSVQVGNIVFYVLNSNPVEPDGVADTSVQALWLQNQLALAGNNWKVVVFHHPPYTSGPHASTTYMQWPFDSWGADAVISGHNHFYERLYKNNVTYFVNGMGGAALYSFSTLISESQFQYNKSWGALKLTPFSDSLIFEFINIRDSLIDRYVFHKDPVGGVTDNALFDISIAQNEATVVFTSGTKKPVDIEICDLEGRIIIRHHSEISDNRCTVDIASLKNGFYIMTICNSDFTASKKIIISR